MYSEEVIERLKAKIPTIKGDHTIYGITQLDIQCCDGSVKQIGAYSFIRIRPTVFKNKFFQQFCYSKDYALMSPKRS